MDFGHGCESKNFNQIYLSTDSKKYEFSKNKNCLCPKLRKKLSGDKITLVDVCLDVLNYIKKNMPDALVLIQ